MKQQLELYLLLSAFPSIACTATDASGGPSTTETTASHDTTASASSTDTAMPTDSTGAIGSSGGGSGGEDYDPFAPQPDEGEGLVNVSDDLEALLEFGALEGACDEYAANPGDRRAKLLCGKWMFFYETFGTSGVPELLVNFFGENFPDEIGDGFSQLGMIPDPYATRSRPLGMAPGKPYNGVDALAYTCASCHFGRLPDGRYAVGAPNFDYEYGKQILTLVLVPALAAPGADPSTHDAAALAAVAPVRDKLAADSLLNLEFMLQLLPLLPSAGMSLGISAVNEGHYASWAPGTMDFVIQPLPFDDGVHTVSKILPLWGIPRETEMTATGMDHAMLAWTGTVPTLHGFLEGFVLLGGGDVAAWPSERLDPLAEYIYSLRAPAPLQPPDPELAAAGRATFWQRGCTECHFGPRGSGLKVYDYAEIGTDDAMRLWLDPDDTGEACCGVPLLPGQSLTHGIKSPRLAGAWALDRFLHNGAVESLEDLLCVDGPRGTITTPAQGDAGHAMTCDNLTAEEKTALLAFLRSI